MRSAISTTHGLRMEKNRTMENQKKEELLKWKRQQIFTADNFVSSFLGDAKQVDVKHDIILVRVCAKHRITRQST